VLNILIALSLLGAAIWWRLLRGLAPERDEVVRTTGYGIGEAVFAAVLALWFLLNIVAAGGGEVTVTLDLILQSAVLYVLLGGAVLGVLAFRRLDPRDYLGLNAGRLGRVFLVAALAFAATYPIVYLADRLSAGWFPRAGEADAMIRFLVANQSAWARIVAGILVVVIAPVTEELIFRGLLYGVVRRYGGRMAAIFTTSLLFAAIHSNFAVMLPLFLLAVGLALAYELTGSLWTPIVMHTAFNAISFALIVFFPGVLEWN